MEKPDYEPVKTSNENLGVDVESPAPITGNASSGSLNSIGRQTSRGFDRILEMAGSPYATKPARGISWSDVNFKVGKKSILTTCWGNVQAGETCAIMGPSGAGKSSLLNVLAGRSGKCEILCNSNFQNSFPNLKSIIHK